MTLGVIRVFTFVGVWVGAVMIGLAQDPVVAGFSPAFGAPGDWIVVEGNNFAVGNQKVVTQVAFNGVAATFDVSATTQLHARVPEGATTGPITVRTSVSGRVAVSPEDFFVGSGPIPVGVDPGSGRVGDVVVLEVLNFIPGMQVFFHDGVEAPYSVGVQVGSSVFLDVLVPAGAVSGPIVTRFGADSNAMGEDFVVVRDNDLGLAMAASRDDPVVGKELIYTLTVTNGVALTGTGIEVVDTLPEGVTYVSAAVSQGTFSRQGRLVTGRLGNLAPSDSATLEITVIPDVAGEIVNQAELTANEPDPVPENNHASLVLEVEERLADLAVVMTTDPEEVRVQEPYVYVITASNLGPLEATNVRVMDVLPAGVETLVPPTTSQGIVQNLAGTVRADLGELASGAEATIRITVVPKVVSVITNTASISGDETDTDAANNEATVVVTPLESRADLQVTQQLDPSQPVVGKEAMYRMTVRNLGPESATGVGVVDTLPASVLFLGSTTSQGTALKSGNFLIAELGMVAPQTEVTVRMRVLFKTATTATNVVEVSANEPDPAAGNNRSSMTVTPILEAPTLEIRLTEAGEVEVSWPVYPEGYRLEATPRLTDPPAWVEVPFPAVEEGGRNRLVLSTSQAETYYRLRRQ